MSTILTPGLDGSLNLTTVLMGDPIRLRYVKRYSTRKTTYQESVAEHSYFVVLFSFFVWHWCKMNVKDWDCDMASVLARAVVHDLEEGRTGDFPRSFKYSKPELRQAIERSSEFSYEEIVDQVTNNPAFAREMMYLWRSSKDKSAAGRIVAFADFLSVLSYMLIEVRDNPSLKSETPVLAEYADSFLGTSFNFMRPLVLESVDLMKKAFNDEEVH